MSTVSLLRDNKLRTTQSREDILKLFTKYPHALSYSDIEKEIATVYDRVTVYRTLKTFLDKGMIHKVLDDGGSLKYALCSHRCHDDKHRHDHVHFKCTECGQTSCLDDVDVPKLKLPKGYQAKEVSLLVQGTCEKCQ